MGEYISKRRLKEIITNAPGYGTDPNVSRNIFSKLVDAGHEIEGYNSSFDPFKLATSVLPSTYEFGKAIYQTIRHPFSSVKGLGTVTLGAIQKLVPGAQDSEQAFDAVVNFYKDRYGSLDRFANTIERDPVGFLSDASVVLGGGATIVKGVAKGAELAGLSRTASAIANTGEWTSRFGRAIEPTQLAKATARTFNKGVGLDKAWNTARSQLTKRKLGITDATEEAVMKLTGEQASRWISDHGSFGPPDIIAQEMRTIQELSREALDAGLSGITKTYGKARKGSSQISHMKDVRGIVNSVERELKSIRRHSGGELSDRFAGVEKTINDLKLTMPVNGASLTELNGLKRAADEVLKLYTNTGDVKPPTHIQNLGDFRNSLKLFIERRAKRNRFDAVRKLNNESLIAGRIAEDIGKIGSVTPKATSFVSTALSAGILGSAFFFRDPIFITGAALFGAERLLSKSTTIRTWLATRLAFLSRKDFATFESFLRSGKHTKSSIKLFREIQQDFDNAMLQPNFVSKGRVGTQAVSKYAKRYRPERRLIGEFKIIIDELQKEQQQQTQQNQLQGVQQ